MNIRVLMLAACAVLGLTTPVCAQPLPLDPQAVTNQDPLGPPPPNLSLAHTIIGVGPILTYPTAAEMQQFYPKRALRMRIEGHVRMKCVVNVSAELEDCVILAETPPDEGFGAAALALAPFFRIGPQRVDGVPTGRGRVILPIGFKPG